VRTVLTVMMRLVFLIAAEERRLLPLASPVCQENYAVSNLGQQLREVADRQTEEVLERATTPGAACWPPSAPCMAASATRTCNCPPMEAACTGAHMTQHGLGKKSEPW
jgi:hypothetical protein